MTEDEGKGQVGASVFSEATKVLGEVQQARESFELQCALNELESVHPPLWRLPQATHVTSAPTAGLPSARPMWPNKVYVGHVQLIPQGLHACTMYVEEELVGLL